MPDDFNKLAKLLDNSSRKRQGTAGDARRGFQSKVQQIIKQPAGRAETSSGKY